MDRKKCPFCGRFAPPNEEYHCFWDEGYFTTNLEESENAVQKHMKRDCGSLDYSIVNFECSNLASPQIHQKEFREISSPRDENEVESSVNFPAGAPAQILRHFVQNILVNCNSDNLIFK
ncbi:hypothetical protein AVEN_274603-1 [Araneus ventricosus]|uniref:Uncharacterized protein n=1 Tax=Araneus ventricosus TaxID=182803 RepID=A0A4Y2NBT5_ARAVE|nr:hypothetical protein AVEN_274603-1 [Araneus ventricosus]